MVFHGFPRGANVLNSVALYLSFLATYAASGWLGVYFARLVVEGGGMAEYLRENLLQLALNTVVVLFLSATTARISIAESRRRTKRDS
jgi:hypothetical protein